MTRNKKLQLLLEVNIIKKLIRDKTCQKKVKERVIFLRSQ